MLYKYCYTLIDERRINVGLMTKTFSAHALVKYFFLQANNSLCTYFFYFKILSASICSKIFLISASANLYFAMLSVSTR